MALTCKRMTTMNRQQSRPMPKMKHFELLIFWKIEEVTSNPRINDT